MQIYETERRLQKHPGVIIKDRIIYVLRNAVGIKTLGRIDFLLLNGYMRRLCNEKQFRTIR